MRASLLVLIQLYVLSGIDTIPANDKDLNSNYDDENSEIGRGLKRRPFRRRRPCIPNGRTFFDWNVQYIDVTNNYNYHIDCGTDGSNRPQKPFLGDGGIGNGAGILNKPGFGGGGGGGLLNKPNKPILGGGNRPVLFGNRPQRPQLGEGGLFQGGVLGPQRPQLPFSLGDIIGAFGSFLPQGGFSNWFQPTNGGGGFLPQFTNGFNNLIPQNFGQGVSNFFQGFTRPPPSGGITNSPQVRPPPPVTTANPDTVDPDDIIYNEQMKLYNRYHRYSAVPLPGRPGYNYIPSGQYLVASNPIFGTFVHPLSRINANMLIVRQFNRDLNQVLQKPLALFGY